MAAQHPEPETPALDAFLRGARLRRLQGQERRGRLRAAFDVGLGPEPLPEELLPLRIMVMWRLVRATAVEKGLCSEDESLDDATDTTPNPWVTPTLPTQTPGLIAAIRRERATRWQRLQSEGKGLPLLPPRNDPAALDRWCRCATIVAKGLGIERHDGGRLGLDGLLDPATCTMCDVSAQQVTAFEDMIVSETLDLLLDVGERGTTKHFREVYGMARRECMALVRLAKSQAMRRTAGSIEEKRALQEARLEDFIGRAREALNMDDEMKALKELAKVQGLTRSDPEDAQEAFFSMVKRVAERQDQEQIEPERQRELLPPGTEIVDAVVLDPHDEEALAEYDKENA